MCDANYAKVVEANIALHTALSGNYQSCEPHFRPENVAAVERRLLPLVEETKARRMLDLGCGTGFMIDIAKAHIAEIDGIDATAAMLTRVDRTGPATIRLFQGDTGSYDVEIGYYDVVTAYSFLHHLFDVGPTLRTAFRALRPGGRLYIDLEPNREYWEAICRLDRNGVYDPAVTREIEMVAFKDEDIEKRFGVPSEVFNNAEYGKSIRGGFSGGDLRRSLIEAGFSQVEVFYHWFIGQGQMINNPSAGKAEVLRDAEVVTAALQRAWPLSVSLFKYLGVTACK